MNKIDEIRYTSDMNGSVVKQFRRFSIVFNGNLMTELSLVMLNFLVEDIRTMLFNLLNSDVKTEIIFFIQSFSDVFDRKFFRQRFIIYEFTRDGDCRDRRRSEFDVFQCLTCRRYIRHTSQKIFVRVKNLINHITRYIHFDEFFRNVAKLIESFNECVFTIFQIHFKLKYNHHEFI
ncbi:hypothetical protein AR158_c668L [Paramecium bursaria Chlorella virus AR158]|uniref:hypothetical protein n=1 Tax=Paramecium bursaria Chlorella virus AR158 TaxID=380598 RepID=UPI00015AA82F|nr:hypothetical protein AR158_c668L [Paramecium bursaria Chlorella virus AR158]ABU44213.1 hypothetical protein AR158_c668L [Paramecium bursaria Chlorella virus AR158]